MKVAVMYSGGKDSCFATWYALHQGWEVSTLITVFSRNPSSFMFHTPNIKWTRLQAEAMGLLLCEISTQGVKEEELIDLKNGIADILRKHEFVGIISGAIESEYQRTRLDNICESLDIRNYTPLWHKDPLMILEEEVGLGFEFILATCAAEGFTKTWLGKKIDRESLKELKELVARFRINPAFEGGEAETFVTDAPLFQKRVRIVEREQKWDLDRGEYIIKKAILVDK